MLKHPRLLLVVLDHVDHRSWDLLLVVDRVLLIDVKKLLGAVGLVILQTPKVLGVFAALVLERVLYYNLLANYSLISI